MSKVILITGASRGLGRAMAEELSKEHIVVANYNKSREKAEDLQNNNLNVDIYQADVSKREEVHNMIRYVITKYGRLDVLINNAGISNEKLLQDITDEDFNSVMNVNLYATFITSQEAVPYMIERKEGLIVNISSIYGTNGGAMASIYSASKAAIDGFTKALAKELGPSNIRVNSIAPGCMNTDMNSYLSEKEWQEIKDITPLGKIGEGIDIARCIRWLIEDKFTTGQVIRIDGGFEI